ncbi:HNH endonuclease [Phaeobacter sp. J2-8]|uniref:HNH endonuclease n=1 Tax=Phaeobacter sp. J2-8 TaxID=2931394 RepID=UPI001FD297D7|nr:HNH endonuclease [Phaeobacter sp. J2-8]MCJ7874211.1 HNH endonuclease [Phaeobacter sp. J2-8]
MISSSVILSESWERFRGRRQPGYSDAIKKLDLVTAEGYDLVFFVMVQGNPDYEKSPSIITEVIEELHAAELIKIGADWIALKKAYVPLLADELPEHLASKYPEGAKKRVTVSIIERNSKARQVCLQANGTQCKVCDIDFEKTYGPVGAGFIHVHHVNPVSLTKGLRNIDPTVDLVPVCPNCHAMLHRKFPPLSIDELRKLMRQSGNSG